MATEADITSLRHDIRSLQQSMAALGQLLGSTTAELTGLKEWVQSLDTTVDTVKLSAAKVSGGWAVFSALAAAAGAAGALVEQLLHR